MSIYSFFIRMLQAFVASLCSSELIVQLKYQHKHENEIWPANEFLTAMTMNLRLLHGLNNAFKGT